MYYFRNELDAFYPEAERALALNPNRVSTLVALGSALLYSGDERGIKLIRKAISLDPFHPTLFHAIIAHYHFARGEYEEALVAARKVDAPDFYYAHILLAAVYAELGRQNEARSAVERLLTLWPSFTIETLRGLMRTWNYREDRGALWIEALRKAGLPD